MISDMLTLLREKNNYTMKDVAEGIGVKPDTYRSYERGRLQPNLEVVCKLADFYGVTTDYLLGREVKSTLFESLSLLSDGKSAMEKYIELPENIRKIILDTMLAFSDATKQKSDNK